MFGLGGDCYELAHENFLVAAALARLWPAHSSLLTPRKHMPNRRKGIALRNGSFTLLASLALSACGPTVMPGTDAGTTTNTDGGFGEETAKGPKVSGKALPPVNVEGRMATPYDLDGDGDAEEIDLDGDGVSDGEDIDGDGQISFIRGTFVEGAKDVPEPTMANTPAVGSTPGQIFASGAPAVEPDDINALDPSEDLNNEVMTMVDAGVEGDGGVTMMPKVIITAPPAASLSNSATNADILTAISQGQQGSCNAFANAALATILRYQREKKSNPTVVPNSLYSSPAYIYTRILGTSACNSGTAIPEALNLFTMKGVATEVEEPYTSGSAPMVCADKNVEKATAPHLYRIGGYQKIQEKNLEFRKKVKDAIAAGIPVVFGCTLPEGFMSWTSTTAGVDVTTSFKNSGQCTNSGHCGGHAMVITGYSEEKNAYRVLNSWGTDWGDKGYVWWDYAALEALNPFAYIARPLTNPQPLPATPAPVVVNRTANGGVVLRQSELNGTQRWMLFVSFEFNEPVTVNTLFTSIDGSGMNFNITTAMQSGELTFLPAGDTKPVAGSTATLKISGKDRAGRPFESQEFTVTVPESSN